MFEAARLRCRCGRGGQLRAAPGVIRIDYVDKKQALDNYRSWAPDMAALAGELEDVKS